jgi:flagellar basal body-associated protein FliL
MAILVEEETGRKGTFGVLIIAVIVIFLGAATYYLFFAPTPLIEVVIPSKLKTVSRISESGLNTPAVFNSPVYRSLRQYVTEPALGEIGRPNPFSPWTTRP